MASSQTSNLDSEIRRKPPFPSLTHNRLNIRRPTLRSGKVRRINLHAEQRVFPRELFVKETQFSLLAEKPSRKRRRLTDLTQDSAVSDPWPCASIKDPCTRRVFSPGCELPVDGAEGEETRSAKRSQGSEDGLCRDVPNCDEKVGGKENGLESVDVKVENINLADDLNEKCVQATPPCAETLDYI